MIYGANNQIQVKGVVLGDTRVGKTSLCVRFHQGTFSGNSATTISASCFNSDQEIEGSKIKFCIWDTAGQERFRSISPIYYRGSHVAIVVFDLTQADSIGIAKGWIKELRLQGPIGIPILVLGNKADLTDQIAIPQDAINEFVKSIGSDYYMVSALDGNNVKEAFIQAACLGFRYYKDQMNVLSPMNQVAPTQPVKKPIDEEKKGCC